MGIRLKRAEIPEDLVPNRAGYGNGQGIVHGVEELSEFCERVGLTRIDRFVVDHCALVERALEASGWVEPETDAEHIAARRLMARIEGEVERGKPWFDPADGLRTVRGLLDLIERGIPMAWREEAWQKDRQRLLDAGVGPEWVERVSRRPTGLYHGPVWDLRTFELDFARREEDVFHLVVSY
jgi:hypothetical protein